MFIEENVSLAAFTTFRLGGQARYLAHAQDIKEVCEALSFAKKKALKVLILGGGSNVLIDDSGFDGLVLKIEFMGLLREGEILIAGAGENWDSLVARAVNDGLWGIENLSGIPGTVGGAPIQNIGAYGAEVKNTIFWVEVFEVESGTVIRIQNTECDFGYRTSRFKKEPGRYVVLRAAFKLKKNGIPNTTYKDLTDCDKLTLIQVRERVLSIRRDKFPDMEVEGTAGSFFLNPVVSAEYAARLATVYSCMPQFPAEGGVKLSLAWLLDNVLRIKGLSSGGARLYERQPLVIVASRGAKSTDVRELAQKVSRIVKNKLGIVLEPEVKIIF